MFMKVYFSLIIVFFISTANFAKTKNTALYNKNGVMVFHTISKVSSFYCNVLNREVIIWKSVVELKNNNSSQLVLQSPCKLKYLYCYMNPSEIERAQSCYGENKLSDIYKNFATTKPTCLKPKETVVNEIYFSTFEDINLRTEFADIDLQYIMN